MTEQSQEHVFERLIIYVKKYANRSTNKTEEKKLITCSHSLHNLTYSEYLLI